jgi:recombination protein RecR
MNAIERLAEKFKAFPGIGPRQAKRFVYFLLAKNSSFLDEFAELLREVKDAVARCQSCCRFFVRTSPEGSRCPTCADLERNTSTLMVVEKEVDFETIERSGAYRGRYFILGGTLPPLEKEPDRRIRARELEALVKARAKEGSLKEIIFALSATVEGDHTRRFLESRLRPLTEPAGVALSTLGRGLSTGLELEYSDAETLKNALANRK